MRMQQISPELALVDPQLAAAARAQLRDPGDCLARRARVAPPAAATDDPVGQAPARARARHILASVGMVVTWIAISALVASPLLAFLPPKASMQPQILEQDDDPAIVATSPQAETVLQTPPDSTLLMPTSGYEDTSPPPPGHSRRLDSALLRPTP